MKYLLIFCICLAYQTTLKLFSMEEKEKLTKFLKEKEERHLKPESLLNNLNNLSTFSLISSSPLERKKSSPTSTPSTPDKKSPSTTPAPTTPKNLSKKTLSVFNKKREYELENLQEIPDKPDKVEIDLIRAYYRGTPPAEVDFLIRILNHRAILSKPQLRCVLVKIVGESDVGKTTLIRSIAQRTSNSEKYLEVDLKDLSDQTQQDIYTSNPEKYIKSLIKNFYQPKNPMNTPTIVAFTKGLNLKGDGFKKLRKFLLEIQEMPGSAPLIVLHEGRRVLDQDGNFNDKIIYIKKPNLSNIKDLIMGKFDDNFYPYENIEDKTIEPLEGSLPPYIQRIAEEVVRNALIEKIEPITNEFITGILNKDLAYLEADN